MELIQFIYLFFNQQQITFPSKSKMKEYRRLRRSVPISLRGCHSHTLWQHIEQELNVERNERKVLRKRFSREAILGLSCNNTLYVSVTDGMWTKTVEKLIYQEIEVAQTLTSQWKQQPVEALNIQQPEVAIKE